MIRKSGFTLAEVLITLGIIGVVAAMTIPTLINQTSGAEYKAGLKKMVSVLNQAITMNVALNDMDFSTLTASTTGNTQSIANMFTNRLAVMNYGAVSACGTTPFTDAANYQIMQLSDGMVIAFPTASASCTSSAMCTAFIDVNGAKKPNMPSTATDDTSKAGLKDQFVLNFFNQQVLPADAKSQYAMYN